MNILLFAACLVCRKVELEPNGMFTFKDRVRGGSTGKEGMYKLVYQAPKSSRIDLTVLGTNGETILNTRDPYSVLYSRFEEDGEVTVIVRNRGRKAIKFGYRCPDVNKEVQGALGPIKDVDQVAELQNVLETIIQSQRLHIKKHEQHAEMVSVSRKWVTRLLVFETLFFLGVLYFLHKDMLKMFETKRDL